jgi:hypothetical protein
VNEPRFGGARFFGVPGMARNTRDGAGQPVSESASARNL